MFSEFCWLASRWLGKGSARKCEEPGTHWLKSGGGVDGGGGDTESCRFREASAGVTAFEEKKNRLQQRLRLVLRFQKGWESLTNVNKNRLQ